MNNIRSRYKKIISISLIVGLASQINIGIMNSGFVVSAGIIFLITFLFYYEDLDPIPTGIISGIFVYIFRLIAHYISKGNLDHIAFSYIFEVVFYIAYSIIYSSLINKSKESEINSIFTIMVICDFSANLIEIMIRTIMGYSPSIWEAGPTLFIVSIMRSIIIWLMINAFKYYGLLLLKEEHEKRYKKLLWLTSQLKSELYWIEKNMDHIERVMTESYELFEKIQNKVDIDTWSNRALAIASNVHEIKKENNLVIRGIKEITENELEDRGMEYKDIINILSETMKRESKRLDKDIEFEFKINNNFFVTKHYFLISILRNLIMNSMDAIDTKSHGKIKITNHMEDNNHVFMVKDNGEGINEEDLNLVFSPGFSTKINYDTGEINRGLGLSIIQNLVVEQSKGDIKVLSKLGQGTSFYIYIPMGEI